MSHDPPPRRDNARTRLLSVIGVVGVGAVAGSLVLWHGQVTDVLGLGADKTPVVSTVTGIVALRACDSNAVGNPFSASSGG